MEAIEELVQLSESMRQASALLADEDIDETATSSSSSSKRSSTFLNVVALGNVVSFSDFCFCVSRFVFRDLVLDLLDLLGILCVICILNLALKLKAVFGFELIGNRTKKTWNARVAIARPHDWAGEPRERPSRSCRQREPWAQSEGGPGAHRAQRACT